MKTAIYIEDGVVQLILTPENAFEKNALKSFYEKPLDVKMFEGTFYDCNGGWSRHQETFRHTTCGPFGEKRVPDSLMFRIEEAKPSPAPVSEPPL
jgi:hypothetical protein